MAIQVRRGNEADFDPSNMLPGEWAVSLDTKYVRMCFSSGICLRMATYEAFEADMAEIRNILAEARTIEEAVARIQTEINDTAIVVEDYAILAKSYAVGGTGTRENEDIDNAKYYYEQAKHISQGGNGLVPLGTIAFENLPTEDILTNAMYNISNDFTSDERFLDGGGILYGKGSNVFYTVDGKWVVLAASDVKVIKGEAEDTFRQGNVNITKGNIGLENVDNTSDADKPISNEQQAEFDRIDSLLGNTDISAIGDGTITGAVRTLNSNLPYLKVSPVADSNGNQLPPSSFRDSALSIGYSHGSYFGLEVTAYIPIITMRWYDSSENIRTIQHALSGITTYTRYSVSSTEWSNWTSGATQSQIDSINSSLNNKIKVTAITGSTGTEGSSGLLSIPRTAYPNAIAIIPIGYDTSFAYRVGAYDISSENFKFGVQIAASGAWADTVQIVFKALVIE